FPGRKAKSRKGGGQAVSLLLSPSSPPRKLSVYRLMFLMVVLVLSVLPVSADRPGPGRSPPPAATPAASLRTLKDFKVELLYSVPKDTEGSWVSACTDRT